MLAVNFQAPPGDVHARVGVEGLVPRNEMVPSAPVGGVERLPSVLRCWFAGARRLLAPKEKNSLRGTCKEGPLLRHAQRFEARML